MKNNKHQGALFKLDLKCLLMFASKQNRLQESVWDSHLERPGEVVGEDMKDRNNNWWESV
jgi:hypothetical protein